MEVYRGILKPVVLYRKMRCAKEVAKECISYAFLSLQVWFQNRRAKFRRNERSALSTSNKGLFTSSPSPSTSGGGVNDSFHHSQHNSKKIEQPILAKSVTSCTGQSVPSYSTIWRPDLSLQATKYAMMGGGSSAGGSSANVGENRGNVQKLFFFLAVHQGKGIF